ncbi:unnamed protein product [Mytilus coruscus]|uniref:C1q domain-containing protein n=1 Tax=Mytilus coruscus TaxID=42192 RepID=A0A6J8BXK4_MYTCO|nr:unnamed protein product [Mytilus coruscus]
MWDGLMLKILNTFKYKLICQTAIYNISSTGDNIASLETSDKSYVGFHAELSNALQNLPHDTIIVFDKIVTNDGGAYDFTAPEDGLYSFVWTTLTKPGHIFHTKLTVDGRVISRSHNNAASTTDGRTATENVVVHLKKGNRVRIQTYQSYGHILLAGWSSFCGFKV